MIKTGAVATNELWRDQWITPPWLMALITQVLGENWLDPCPSHADFNGITIDWPGSVYINPPFSYYKYWVDHGLTQDSYQQIWMANNATETRWFQTLLMASDCVLLFNSRIKFIHPCTGLPGTSPRQAQVLFYRGQHAERFKEVFQNMGSLLKVCK